MRVMVSVPVGEGCLGEGGGSDLTEPNAEFQTSRIWLDPTGKIILFSPCVIDFGHTVDP